MSVAVRPKTFDELYREIEALPEGQRGEILDEGQLHITMGRPGKPHRRAAKLIQDDLRGVDGEVGGTGWWLEIETEVRFGRRLCDPDLAAWEMERVPELPIGNPIAIVPDWCCEVLSPSTARDDRQKKLPIYIREGVAHVWIVDPEAHLVEVFAPADGRPTLIASASDEDDLRLPPFDLDVHPSRWWLSPVTRGSDRA